MDKILIIEDNKDVNMILAETLISAGYETYCVYTGIDGLKEIKKHPFDMILLDLMLPYKSGDEVLMELREISDVPVIIISAKDMVETKIDMLRLGADDYVTKPFDINELTARVESNLRRYHKKIEKESRISYKDMLLDDGAKRIEVNNVILDLTAKEYLILELLLKSRGKVFTKANLYESVWKDEYIGDDNAVKTHISNLRGKLKKANDKEDYIETVWGLGYRLYNINDN